MLDIGIFRSISYILLERKCFFEWFVSTFQVLHPLVFHFWFFFAGEPSKIDCFWRNIELWQPKMKSFSCKIIFFETYLKTSVLTVLKVPKRNINTKCWITLWNTKKSVFWGGFHQCNFLISNTKGSKLLGLKQLVSPSSFAFVEYLTCIEKFQCREEQGYPLCKEALDGTLTGGQWRIMEVPHRKTRVLLSF